MSPALARTPRTRCQRGERAIQAPGRVFMHATELGLDLLRSMPKSALCILGCAMISSPIGLRWEAGRDPPADVSGWKWKPFTPQLTGSRQMAPERPHHREFLRRTPQHTTPGSRCRSLTYRL